LHPSEVFSSLNITLAVAAIRGPLLISSCTDIWLSGRGLNAQKLLNYRQRGRINTETYFGKAAKRFSSASMRELRGVAIEQ
jgi:hypothetical protein